MAYQPLSLPDESTYTEGSSPVAPVGGEFNDASPDVVAGKVATIRITKKRSAHVNLRDSAGVELGTVGNPVNVTSAGGSGGPATIADGADVAQGSTTDAAITSDTDGTVIGFLRGLVMILASVWDSLNGRLKVDASAVAVPVTDNGGSLTVDGSVTVLSEPTMTDRTGVALFTGVAQSLGVATPGCATAKLAVDNVFVASLQVYLIDLANIGPIQVYNVGTGTFTSTITTRGLYEFNCAGVSSILVLCSAFTSGTVRVSLVASSGAGPVHLDAPLPAGTNPIGSVTLNAGISTIGSVTGTKTSNNAEPDGTALATLPVIATARWPNYTDEYETSLSGDLLGRTRVHDWAVRSELKNVTGLLMEIRDLLTSERT